MCLILFAYRRHAQYPFVLAANRDEFHTRPTVPLHPWDETPPRSQRGPECRTTADPGWVSETAPGGASAGLLRQEGTERQPLHGPEGSSASNNAVLAERFAPQASTRGEKSEAKTPILAGRDLQAGGTWLGLSAAGRLAAVTNFRGTSAPLNASPSRGGLTLDFLQGEASADAYLAQLKTRADRYQGFNLLLGDHTGLWYFSNRAKHTPQRLTAGIYGLSNHLLDTDWPKISRGKHALAQILNNSAGPSLNALLDLLQDRWQPPSDTLPDTGIGLQREQQLAPIFIRGDDYGTRCSTALLLDRNGHWNIAERSYSPSGASSGELRCYHWPAGPLSVLSAACHDDLQAGSDYGI